MTGDFPARQGPSDTILWVIERDPVLRSTIVALALLDDEPDWEQLRARVNVAIAGVPRLRQRVRDPLIGVGPGRWEDVEVDLDYHLRRVSAPPPAGLRSVLDLAAAFATAPLDRRRPLWEFTLVSGVDGGAAFIQKLHHSLTDGIGGIRLALSLYELADDLGRAPETASGDRVPAARAERPTLLDGLRSTARLLAPAPTPLSPLMRERGLSWRFDVIDVPLETLRTAGHRHGGSVNDALVTAVTRGLAYYHGARGAPTDELRVMMPVSTRGADDPPGGNHFVPVRMRVPTLVVDPGRHVEVIHELTTAWRAESSMAFADSISVVLAWLPRPATTFLFGSMLKGCDVVVTNVPGFNRPVSLAGTRVTHEYAFAPPSGAALNVALLSHEATGCVAVTVDATAVPDRGQMLDCLRRGFGDVIALATDETGTDAAPSVPSVSPASRG